MEDKVVGDPIVDPNQEPTTTEPGDDAKWYDSASDDYKTNEAMGLKDSATMDDFFAKHSEMSKGFEDLKSKQPVIPESADKYELPLPDGITDESQTLNPFFREAAHASGLTQEQATALATGFTDQMVKQVQAMREAGIKELQGTKTDQEFEKFKATSVAALAKYAEVSGIDADAQKTFVAQYGDDPAIIKMMNFFGEKMSEGGWVPGQGIIPGDGKPVVGTKEYYIKMGFPEK